MVTGVQAAPDQEGFWKKLAGKAKVLAHALAGDDNPSMRMVACKALPVQYNPRHELRPFRYKKMIQEKLQQIEQEQYHVLTDAVRQWLDEQKMPADTQQGWMVCARIVMQSHESAEPNLVLVPENFYSWYLVHYKTYVRRRARQLRSVQALIDQMGKEAHLCAKKCSTDYVAAFGEDLQRNVSDVQIFGAHADITKSYEFFGFDRSKGPVSHKKITKAIKRALKNATTPVEKMRVRQWSWPLRIPQFAQEYRLFCAGQLAPYCNTGNQIPPQLDEIITDDRITYYEYLAALHGKPGYSSAKVPRFEQGLLCGALYTPAAKKEEDEWVVVEGSE